MRIEILKLIGIATCLVGAVFMFHGGILGENTTGIATLIGIVGIGILSTSNRRASHEEKKALVILWLIYLGLYSVVAFSSP
jgi:hypothetical protein